MAGDAQDCVDEPEPAAPETHELAMPTSGNDEHVDEGPAKLLELVGVEALLKGKHEEHHPDGHQAEADQRVVPEKHGVGDAVLVNEDARVSKQLVGTPGFENAEELEGKVKVPLDPLGLNLDMHFFVRARL